MKIRNTKINDEKQKIIETHFNELNELFGHNVELVVVGSKEISHLGQATSSLILIRNTKKLDQMIETLAHEMMHVRQFATVEDFDTKYENNKKHYEYEADKFSWNYMKAKGEHYTNMLSRF